ncbi:PIG-L deacetylase family protein [Sphingomonas sp. LaA6.9]|uniref:PIG-L deacetylase family protein n=1 Tax=Sphingomonas sp. LaA6.9 TaxID=2919914 RepID=UPI001F4FCE38|nr:PIG-L deacetylase family protein [Sphingomonas sp. LaA6.9]MCJ8158785.1 PIG-L family deacetylase [Sphingomonas sp. LaA6.9]
MLEGIERAMVIAPHPDDEVLGCGGTIARLAATGCRVTVVLATRGKPPRFNAAAVGALESEMTAAHARLGVSRRHWLDFPAAELDRVPHAVLNDALHDLVAAERPEVLFVPFIGDIHLDHQILFQSSLVAARPSPDAFPRLVLAYETLSETNWYAPYVTPGFLPTVFVDIADHLTAKLEAFGCYASQVKPFPHERSTETLGALAKLRGATVCKAAAEAFVLVRALA